MHLYYRDYNSEDRIYFSNSTVHLVFGSKGAVDGSGALSVKSQPRVTHAVIYRCSII